MMILLRILMISLFVSGGWISAAQPPDNFFSSEEKKAALVIKEVYRDNSKSSHTVLMNGAEKPHYHDLHSFEVVLVQGTNRLHLGDKVIDLVPNKPVRVEKGTLHWAENTGKTYSILSVSFYPPFDGKDRRFAP
jgi:mannose-6-phosphate isomerase-like protein (cupin superfamily)